jgi:hypothetical protein
MLKAQTHIRQEQNLTQRHEAISGEAKEFVSLRRENTIGAEAFAKYLKAVGRLQNIDRTHTTQTLAQPRKRYLGSRRGCNLMTMLIIWTSMIAPTMITLAWFPTSSGNESMTMVILANSGRRFSDLPSGLTHDMSAHPTEFKNCFNQRRHELGL